MEIIVDFESWSRAAMGGGLIGLSAALLILANGRIAGVSGVLGGLIFERATGDAAWRILFLAGMVTGAFLMVLLRPELASATLQVDWPGMIVAGLLVGFGVRMGGGCTSGHGVCGIARFSARSIIATCTFMVVAAATVFLVRHVIGGGA